MMGWMWILWALVLVISFALIESYALKHSARQWTLSRCCAWLGTQWPLTLFIAGIICGGLAVHFWGSSWNCSGGGQPQ